MCILALGDCMTTDLLEDIEAMRYASRDVERAACDWLELRRQILAYGGIGPSKDWPRDWAPGDLYRASGPAPDLVAAEAVRNAPWGDTGDDSAMLAYLRRSLAQWEAVKVASARQVTHRAPAPVKLRPGLRSFAELVAELKRKHGPAVDLGGLGAEYVSAYET